MNKKTSIIGMLIVILTLFFSGCTDLFTSDDGSTIYEAHPTKISYTITYGYNISCIGSEDINIVYDCDTPEVLSGDAEIIKILYQDYTNKSIATFNLIKRWNLSEISCNNYQLGLTANITSESFLVSDLNGGDALTLQELQGYAELIDHYCQAQSNETITFINPDHPDIITQSQTILDNTNSNNVLIIAKEIFKWLKQYTTYSVHIADNNVQPDIVTLQKKTGDCDDLSFLYISLCRSLDIPSRFIRGFLIDEDQIEAHAWVEVYVGGPLGMNGWIPVECAGTATGDNKIETEIHQNFGVESASHLRLFKDDGSNESIITSLSGISYIAGEDLNIQTSPIRELNNYQVTQKNKLYIDKNGNRNYQ